MRTGRPPEEGTPRTEVVCVRLTQQDVQNLDRIRGEQSRSGYFRASLREASTVRSAR